MTGTRRPGRPESCYPVAARLLHADRREGLLSRREHQPDRARGRGRALLAGRHGRERAEGGDHGLHLGRTVERDLARGRGPADHHPVRRLAVRAERPGRRVVAPVTGCWDEPRVERRRGAASRAATARRQPDQGRGSDQDLCCSCGHAGILPSTLRRSAAGYGSAGHSSSERHVGLGSHAAPG